MHYCLIAFVALLQCAVGSRFLAKDRGSIFFYEDSKVLDFDIDLKPYYEHAKYIANLTRKLESSCKNLEQDLLCNEYISDYVKDLAIVRYDINYIKNHVKRRRWISPGLSTFGRMFLKVIAGKFAIIGLTWSFTNSMKDMDKIQNVTSTEDILTVQNLTLELNDRTFLENKKTSNFQNMINKLTLMKLKHQSETGKLRNILNHNIRKHFFEYIDYNNFIEQIDNENRYLGPNQTLPKLGIDKLFDISTIIVTKQTDFIRISIKLPILSNQDDIKYAEIIPLPFSRNGNTYIYDINSVFFIQNSEKQILIIPDSVLKNCIHYDSIVLCNSMEYSHLLVADTCVRSIILGEKPKCTYKPIENKTYWLKTSKFSIFCYIVEPLRLRITCNDRSMVYHLTESREIYFEINCDIYQLVNEITYNATSHTTVEVQNDYLIPNLTYYDTNLQNWNSNVSYINTNRIIYLKAKDRINNLNNKMSEHMEFKGFMDLLSTPFEVVLGLVHFDFIRMILIFIVMPFCVFVTLSCLCCFTRCR